MTDVVRFQADLAEAANALTEVRLLNNGDSFQVGNGDSSQYNELISLLDSVTPGGGTPLCRHVDEVVAKIKMLEPELRANGQKAVLVIATDGEPSDGDVTLSLEKLHNLPVWVVLCLCTDDQHIVNYW